MLQAWERGRERVEPWRALALLESAMPEQDMESLAALPLAERNKLLLELHSLTFGPQLLGFAVCPECGEQLESVVHAGDLFTALHAPDEEAWFEGDTKMLMRPVNTRDLAAAMNAQDSADARAVLLERTMTAAGGLEPALERERVSERVQRFERLNTSAEIRCVLPCSGCGTQVVLDLDIARFLWREVTVAARRLLAEIHRLAQAYGWAEQAIATMNATRRAAYLEMLGA